MENNTAKNIPANQIALIPMKGEVCEQHIRCGKAGCHCQEGALHGPYYYRIWREGAQVRKVYVKQAELEAVRQACAAYKQFAGGLREQRLAREQLTRRIQRAWRTAQNLQKASPRRRRLDTEQGGY